jgi:hypothetical protein
MPSSKRDQVRESGCIHRIAGMNVALDGGGEWDDFFHE